MALVISTLILSPSHSTDEGLEPQMKKKMATLLAPGRYGLKTWPAL